MNIKQYFRKENIIAFTLSVLITGLLFIGRIYLGNDMLWILGIITGLLLVVSLGIIMFITGYMVLKALFFVAAEISLIIFLAQSYCAVPHSIASEQSLKSLLILGFFYIIVAFFRKFYEITKEKYPTIAKERWSKEKIIFVTSFFVFSILLIWQIYQVVSPIIMDLCVYQ